MPQFHGGTLTAIKWASVVLMVLDHLDGFVYGGALGLHATVGRLVFPVFGFLLAYNAARPRALLDGVHGRMMWRTLLVGVLALPVYVPLAGWYPLNIMFSLALGVLVINACAHGDRFGLVVVGLFALVAGAFVDYQWFGLAYMLAVWGAYARGWSPWWILAGAVSLWPINGNLVAVLALPLLWLASQLRLDLPRHQLAFYAVYPAHLLAIGAVLYLG